MDNCNRTDCWYQRIIGHCIAKVPTSPHRFGGSVVHQCDPSKTCFTCRFGRVWLLHRCGLDDTPLTNVGVSQVTALAHGVKRDEWRGDPDKVPFIKLLFAEHLATEFGDFGDEIYTFLPTWPGCPFHRTEEEHQAYMEEKREGCSGLSKLPRYKYCESPFNGDHSYEYRRMRRTGHRP